MIHDWQIKELKRTVSDGVVNHLKFNLYSTHNEYTNIEKFNLDITGSLSDENFVPFSDLTEDIVFGWITSSMDTSAIEVLSSASIAQMEVTANERIKEETGFPWEDN